MSTAVLVDPSSGQPLPLQGAAGGQTTRARLGAQCECGTAVGAVMVQVPLLPTEGQVFAVNDLDGNAGTNNITVLGAGQLIDGAASLVVSNNNGNAFFIYDRSQWRRMQSLRRLDNPPSPPALLFMLASDEAIPAGAAVTAVTASAPITSSGGATPNIAITAATGAAAGSMSAADKTKLDAIGPGAAVASVAGTAPIASSGGANPNISISAATTGAAGSLSAADKTKLDGLQKQGATIAIAALAIDWSLGGSYSKTLAAGANAITFANAADGQVILVELTSDAGGSTVTWPAGIRWAGGIPTQTPTGVDVYTFVRFGANIDGSAVQDAHV